MNCITSVSYSILPQGFSIHEHDEHELILIVSGTAILKNSTGEHRIAAPALVSIGHLEKHAVTASGEYERYVLTLRPEMLSTGSERLQLFFAPQFQVIDVSDFLQPMQTLFELLLAEAQHREEPADGGIWLLQSLLLLLYRNAPEFFPSGSSTAQTVRRVQYALEQNLSEKILLGELAEQFHLSVFYLSHSFKEITGYGVLQYRLMVKLSVACELLSQTDETISDIGEKSGFPDASSFARQFKKSLGCTPRQYRERAQGEPIQPAD